MKAPKFRRICSNCGDYTPAQAYSAGLLEREPLLVFFPKSITVMLVMTALTLAFVLIILQRAQTLHL